AFDGVRCGVPGEADCFFAALCGEILEHGRELPAAILPEGVAGPVHRRQASGARGAATQAPRANAFIALGAPPQPIGRPVVHNLDDTSIPDYDEVFDAPHGSTVRD